MMNIWGICSSLEKEMEVIWVLAKASALLLVLNQERNFTGDVLA